MSRDLTWRVLVLSGLLGAVYINEKYNLANPALEQKLAGCWAGATPHEGAYSGAIVLEVDPDGTFRETGVEKLSDDPMHTKVVSASGTWGLQKDRWTLKYKESTALFLLPRARQSLQLTVLEVNEQALRATRDHPVSRPYNLSKVPPGPGRCQTPV